MKQPICPVCCTTMKPRYFVGYYEQFSFWSCQCKVIPGSTVEAGDWADAEQNQTVEEYFG